MYFHLSIQELEDKSQDFVPLEQRLRTDPVFQEKVRSQRQKLAAQKAAEEAAAKKKKMNKQTRPTAKKSLADNIASVRTNRANFRFYSRSMKVSTEALDTVHDIVDQWVDFTLDQMEVFCANKGKESLDTWEDCMDMLISQGIVKNYAEYSGLCHELLSNDECATLLPGGSSHITKQPSKKNWNIHSFESNNIFVYEFLLI